MDFSIAIDVSIGLILTYFVLSLICTSVNESISGLLRLRARVLFSELDRILDDDRVRNAFWNSGLIRSLSRKRGVEDEARPSLAPSYIASDTFARALLQALREIETDADVSTPADTVTADFRATKGIRPDSVLGNVLLALAGETQQSADELKTALGAWFDQVMERTTGVYKRHMNVMTFLVATIIVIVLDADTIEFVEVLWRDDALRSQLVQVSIEAVNEGSSNPEDIGTLTRSILSLPFGWEGQVTNYPVKVFGLLLSSFSLTLGAPVWFDLLSRFVAVRNSGPLQGNFEALAAKSVKKAAQAAAKLSPEKEELARSPME